MPYTDPAKRTAAVRRYRARRRAMGLPDHTRTRVPTTVRSAYETDRLDRVARAAPRPMPAPPVLTAVVAKRSTVWPLVIVGFGISLAVRVVRFARR